MKLESEPTLLNCWAGVLGRRENTKIQYREEAVFLPTQTCDLILGLGLLARATLVISLPLPLPSLLV